MMIQVNNVTRTYGPVVAVDHVSFEVDRGEVVGFLGPNGAGKTTTLRILTTFLPATSGIARVAGYDVMTQSMQVRQHIGYLPESVPLYGEMRVEEYLLFRATLKNVPRRERQKRVEYCLDRCRIREVRRRLIGTLSRGYKQRVGLADAMVHDPDILLLDEPTSGLDPIQSRDTLTLIRELGEQHTILLSTHILPQVEAVCERVIIINAGRVGLVRKMAEIATDRATIVTEVRGPVEAVTEVLRSTSGVVAVESRPIGDGLFGYEVNTLNNQDLREVLSRRLAERQWPIRRLDLRQRKLEDLFMEVVVRGTEQAPDQPIEVTDVTRDPTLTPA